MAADNGSGLGVVVGVLLAVVIVVGGYYFMNSHNGGTSTTIETPDVSITTPAK